jgi:hypothetical protein
MLLALAIVVAAALLSLWIFARFEDHAPSEFRRGLLHMGLSLVVFYVARPLLTPVVELLAFPVDRYVLVFVIVVPALTYRFVSTLWLLNLAQRAARSGLS